MTVNDAYNLLLETNSKLRIAKCTEYPSRYVFATASKHDNNEFGNLYAPLSVHKETGEVTIFHPSDISFTEFLEGKEIESWDEKSAGENYIKHNSDMLNGVFVYKK